MPRSEPQGTWESFDGIAGLGHYCHCLLQDAKGRIWVGASNALSCYDGSRFISFTMGDGLAGDNIRCLHQDRHGLLWIGTNTGLSSYDGKNFVNFTMQEGLVGNEVRSLCEDSDGKLWIGTTCGLSCYDGEEFTNMTEADGLPHHYISSVLEDTEGRLWIGTWMYGLSRYDGQGFSNFTTQDGLIGDHIRCLYETEGGVLWIGATGGLSYQYGERFVSFAEDDGLASNYVLCIAEDQHQHLWIGTQDGGLSHYDGEDFVTLDTERGLVYTAIHDILHDREGCLWFACGHGGLAKYDPLGIRLISDQTVNEVMYQDSHGDLWWGSQANLCHLQDGEVRQYPFESRVFDLCEDSRGQFWVATDGNGVALYQSPAEVGEAEPQVFTTQNGLMDDRVIKIYEDAEERIWLGQVGCLSYYDGQTFTNLTEEDGINIPLVSAICQDAHGTLWFAGFLGVGVTSYDGRQCNTYTPSTSGLLDGNVQAMIVDKENHLWIGTTAGVSRYDGESFSNYTTADGLLGHFVQRLMQDSRGDIWIATLDSGLCRFDGHAFQALTMADGLPSNHVTGVTEADDGSVLIATYKGICRYTPDRNTPPFILIEEVDADTRYANPTELRIAQSTSSIAIRFHGISLQTKRFRYHYQLEGYDQTWQATWDEEVRYDDLPIGRYTFWVTAISRDFVRASTKAMLALEIVPDARDEMITVLEEHVKESEQRFRNIVHASPMGIYMVELEPDDRLLLIEGNPAAGQIIGTDTEQIVGKHLEDTFPAIVQTELPERLKQAATQGIAWRTTDFAIVNDGSRRVLEIHIFQTSPGRAVAMFSDMTELRQAEERERELHERAEEQEKLAATGQLAAGIAHDFNNLLTSILGYAEVMLFSPALPMQFQNNVRVILQQAQRAAQLVQQILDFSRKSATQQRPLELASFLRRTIESLRQSIPQSITIRQDYAPGGYAVQADATQLQQVMMNLVANAQDAMSDGGELRVQLSSLSLGLNEPAPLPDMPAGEWAVISVSDSGTGIPEDALPHIYEPFFTTKEVGRGSGLGLSQVYGIVKQHQGAIDVESTVGEGTSFRIYLPKTELTDERQASALAAPKEREEVILIVEESPTVLNVLQSMLVSLDYGVFTATNGDEASRIYHEHRESIALVLTDMIVSKTGGVKVYRALQEQGAKVMLITDHPLGEKAKSLMSEGILGWVQKPVSLQHLAEVLREVLDG